MMFQRIAGGLLKPYESKQLADSGKDGRTVPVLELT